jgi:hypothetical protein
MHVPDGSMHGVGVEGWRTSSTRPRGGRAGVLRRFAVRRPRECLRARLRPASLGGHLVTSCPRWTPSQLL